MKVEIKIGNMLSAERLAALMRESVREAQLRRLREQAARLFGNAR